MANKRLNATITIGGAIAGSLKSALGDTKSKLTQLGSAVKQLNREQRNLADSITVFGKMGKNVDGLRARYAAVTTELDRQRRSLERLKSVEASRKANIDKRHEIGGKIGSTVALGASLAVPIGMAMAKTTEFNYQLQLIGNTANMSKAEVVQLGSVILAASRKTNTSAQDMQKALGFLIAAGMDVKTASLMMEQVGKSATATGGDIEDLAKAAFTLNDSLGIKPGREMQAALDTLASAGKDGNVELKDMAKVLPVLGSGFQALKMGGREAAASMGAALEIARKGAADADEAANNMKNFIAKIMSPETLKKAKKNFNLDLYKIIQDSQKSGGNPFEASMIAIMKATKGDQKAIGDLFSDMQVQNFIRPMIQNWDKYKEIKDRALKADGTIDRDYDLIMKTSKMKVKELTTAFGRLALAIGDAMEKGKGDSGSSWAGRIEAVTAFVRANEGLVGTTVKVVGGLIGLRLVTLGAGWAYTFLKGGILSTIGMFYRFAPAAAAAGTASTAAAGGATLLGRAFMFVGKGILWLGRALLLNPIGIAVSVIAGGAYLIYKNWGTLGPMFKSLWADITATFKTSIDWIMKKIAWIGDTWNKTKALVGLGDGVAPGGPAGPGGIPVALPSTVSAPRSTRAVPKMLDSSTNNFNIYQLPGESQQQLAERIAQMQKDKRGVNQRSAMTDGGGAQ
jgi:TP901 family phage tail tape measure protein